MSTPFCYAGWQKASIFNPLNGSVIQFNTLNPAMTNYERPAIKQEHTFGNYQSGKTHKLSFGGFGLTQESIDLLQTWARDKTLVQAVCAGTGKAMQWYESVEISEILTDFKGKRNAGDNSYGVVLTCDKHDAQIYHNENLLAYLGWADLNLNGLPDGYDVKESVTGSVFSSNTHSFIASGGPSASLYKTEIVFPISGITLTNSIKVVDPHLDGGTRVCGSRIFNVSFAPVDIANNSIGTPATAGTILANTVVFNTLQSIATVYSIRFEYGIQIGHSSDTISFSFPAITTNGKNTYSTKFMNQ